jgi:hypothetical protein
MTARIFAFANRRPAGAYLGRDIQLAEQAVLKLEARTKL